MENGWIKLHRKIIVNPICKKPAYAWLWVMLLLLANHKGKKIMWNGDVLIIKEGQILTGRKQLSEQSGIPETTIERALAFLEKQGNIGQQKTTKFRLITVINWKEYQSADNKRTTSGQQTDTNKNDKNEKNNKLANASVALEDLVYEPLEGIKTKRAFADRARAKIGKPKMLHNNPEVYKILEKYQIQFKYVTGKRALLSDADYFHVLSVTKKLSPQEMEEMIIWYVKMDNPKFKQHPGLKSIFTQENIIKFNMQK